MARQDSKGPPPEALTEQQMDRSGSSNLTPKFSLGDSADHSATYSRHHLPEYRVVLNPLSHRPVSRHREALYILNSRSLPRNMSTL